MARDHVDLRRRGLADAAGEGVAIGFVIVDDFASRAAQPGLILDRMILGQPLNSPCAVP